MTPNHPRLLLVENAATRALRISRMLETYGFEIESVESAEAALDCLDDWIPILVVTDFRLPGMDGSQMARQLRLNAVTRAIPVLMLTDGHDPELERDVLMAGIDACIPRSADTSLLAFRIRALLREDVVPQSPARGLFRRPVIAVATGPGGALVQWGLDGATPDTGGKAIGSTVYDPPAGMTDAHATATIATGLSSRRPEAAGVSRLPIISLLRSDGMETMVLDRAVLDTPKLWIPAVDCVIVDLSCPAFDGIALVRALDAARGIRADSAPARLLGFGMGAQEASQAYTVGLDDLVGADIEADFMLLHVRALLRRKVLQDENRRSEAERAAREEAMQGARAKAALAEALEQANIELATANRKLIDAQTKLVQSAKMASLGELVAGIAHEFNNPLAFVLAHEDTVARNLDKAAAALTEGRVEEARVTLDKSRDRLGASSVGLGRMRDLVSSLRRFSRLDQGSFADVNMPEAIGTVLSLLGPKLGEHIEVECIYAAPAVLRCQAALVHQVVMNVISNAADAFGSESDSAVPGHRSVRGRVPRIVITTALAHMAERHPASGQGDEEEPTEGSALPWTDEPHTGAGEARMQYVITICDNGPGIPPLMRERVFEPFFTTKPVGVGTGLGLATAYGVVQAHGGSIEVGESPEGGACFTISVPFRTAAQPERSASETSPSGGVVHGMPVTTDTVAADLKEDRRESV